MRRNRRGAGRSQRDPDDFPRDPGGPVLWQVVWAGSEVWRSDALQQGPIGGLTSRECNSTSIWWPGLWEMAVEACRWHGLFRADSAPTGVASGRTGVRTLGDVPTRAQKQTSPPKILAAPKVPTTSRTRGCPQENGPRRVDIRHHWLNSAPRRGPLFCRSQLEAKWVGCETSRRQGIHRGRCPLYSSDVLDLDARAAEAPSGPAAGGRQ